ncbi:hypothetical protein Dtox_1921 [Desulfofarcimen acetoxidans DSM 771]|uniref:Uncharacterized protein n=1 Tax=Desulfofarcimen acetoxidans (strain ATCC 49208 / DSM 771 / KCTC 5769 / VKM B-1644 / 5575) TaxID=485916 RepID=C8VY80_DESAS|nr:hypothetical protein Dtox_1921 [Desulfofarcimen acetoxidans DSM 771]
MKFNNGIFNALVEKIEVILPTHFVFVLKRLDPKLKDIA